MSWFPLRKIMSEWLDDDDCVLLYELSCLFIDRLVLHRYMHLRPRPAPTC